MKIDVLGEEIEAMVSFLGKGDQGFVFVTLLVSDRFEVVSCLRLAVDVVVGVSYACDRWSVVSDRLAALEWKSVPLEGSLVCKVVEGVCRFGSFMGVGLFTFGMAGVAVVAATNTRALATMSLL